MWCKFLCVIQEDFYTYFVVLCLEVAGYAFKSKEIAKRNTTETMQGFVFSTIYFFCAVVS